jgi:hypothetical protein
VLLHEHLGFEEIIIKVSIWIGRIAAVVFVDHLFDRFGQKVGILFYVGFTLCAPQGLDLKGVVSLSLGRRFGRGGYLFPKALWPMDWGFPEQCIGPMSFAACFHNIAAKQGWIHGEHAS